MKNIILLSLGMFISGCAASNFGAYNPNNLPSEQFATIHQVKKSFSEALFNSTSYRIVSVNEQDISWLEGNFSKFTPGIHIINWIFTDWDDYGVVSVERILDQGTLVVNLKPHQKYTIGLRESDHNDLEVWHSETLSSVSKPCNKNNCQKILNQLRFIEKYGESHQEKTDVLAPLINTINKQ